MRGFHAFRSLLAITLQQAVQRDNVDSTKSPCRTNPWISWVGAAVLACLRMHRQKTHHCSSRPWSSLGL